jgi:hypothetical protein
MNKRLYWIALTLPLWVLGCRGQGGDIANPSEHHVKPGDDLQKVLDAVKPGDRVYLDSDGVWEGSFVLRRQPLGAPPITITGWEKPPIGPNERVTPDVKLATLKRTAGGEPILRTEAEAHGYTLQGLHIHADGVRLLTLIQLGDTATSRLEDQPQNIVIDQCYIHGDPKLGSRRGIALNSGSTVVKNSLITEIKDDVDNQAINGVNGPGPYTIENNTIEAACENIMFGGAPARIKGLNPADILIKGNLIRKRLEWREERRPNGKPRWSFKNLVELKRGERVRILDNRLENSWEGTQRGFALVFTVRAEGRGGAVANPWAAIRDVVVRNNEIYNVGSGVNVLGKDGYREYMGELKNLVIENNRFWINPRFGGDTVFQVLTGAEDVTIRNNTAVFLFESKRRHALLLDGPPKGPLPPNNPRFECTEPVRNLVVEKNILEGDVSGRSLPPGDKPIVVFTRDAKVKDNIFIAGRGIPIRNKRAKRSDIGFTGYPENLGVLQGEFKDYGAR